MNPSWYDLLGVAPDASADQIRSAWRAEIAELDPTDRRFGVLNRAAEVLLDPGSRAAYDEELAPVEPVAEKESSASVPRVLVPGWLLIGLAAVTLIVAGVAGYLAVRVPSDGSVEEATTAARAAAERAVVPVLSYDATHIDQSRTAAEGYLTSDYRKKYDQLFDAIIERNAPSTGTVLKADLVRSGVVRSGDDRVQVFVLVNQTRTNKKYSRPQVYKNWVTMTMQNVDGNWLVADMTT